MSNNYRVEFFAPESNRWCVAQEDFASAAAAMQYMEDQVSANSRRVVSIDEDGNVKVVFSFVGESRQYNNFASRRVVRNRRPF